MHIKLNKDKFTAIDGAFLVLKEDHQSKAALEIIKTSLESCFGTTFDVSVVQTVANQPIFIMSVFPEISTIDKIISAVSSNKETDSIKKLWENNKRWTIELDEKIFSDNIISCSNKELTAALLHEVGHIVTSTSIPNRISLIMRYEISKTSLSNKMMLKDKLFRTVLSLPILNACVCDGKRDKSSIKDEIKADSFVKKMGYHSELLSVLTKISDNARYTNSGTINDNLKEVTNYSLNTLGDIQARKAKLAKRSLLSLREACQSPFIESVLNKSIDMLFEDNPNSLSFINGRKEEYTMERADKDIEEGYFTEFFGFGTHNLKRIDPAELDYVDVKINQIKSEDDKMMLVSYIHSKIDEVEYYISILENPSISKKYNIPHSIDQLQHMKKRLLLLRDAVLKYRIPERNKGILVAWPAGYEG